MRAELRLTAVLVLAVGACGGGESPDPCDRLVERMEKCGGDAYPISARWNAKLYCRVSMRYEPEAGDHPGNAAEIIKATLTECAGPGAATCDGLMACFERHRCTFVMASPSDSPQFQCWQ